jgi:hypothetical protein
VFLILYFIIKVDKDIIKAFNIKVVYVVKEYYIYILLIHSWPISKSKRQDLILI